MPSRTQARLDALHMLHDIEQHVKNFDPIAYTRFATLYIDRGLSNNNAYALWRPHDLIHSIDACFAYARRHATKTPTEQDIRRILNLYNTRSDPLLDYYLTDQRALGPAMSLLARKQFLFQHRPDYRDFGRAAFMFLEQSMPRSDALLRERYGIATPDWLFLLFGTYAVTIDERSPILNMGQIERFIHEQRAGAADIMTPGAASAILRSIGRTPQQIADSYNTHVSSLNDRGLLHTIGLREPSLLETPLIALDQTHFLCPAPNLVSLAFLRGMSRLGTEISPDVFGDEIGAVLEGYIGALMTENTSFTVVPEGILKGSVTKKTCDFACISRNCTLLIECKAVAKPSRSVDPQSVRQSPFAGQVSRGIVQLVDVAQDIRDGRLRHLGCEPDAPIYAFVVTIAFDAMADSPWYWSTVWEPETQNELGPVQTWSDLFGHRPYILSVDAFEEVVWFLSMTGDDLAQVFREYSAQDYVQTGSIAVYARSKLRDRKGPRKRLQPAHRAYGEAVKAMAPAALGDVDTAANQDQP